MGEIDPNFNSINKDIMIIDVNDEKDAKSLSQSELWDEIGFHKAQAGFWYNIILYQIVNQLALVALFGDTSPNHSSNPSR